MRTIHDGWLRVIGICFMSTIVVLGDNLARQPLTALTMSVLALDVVRVGLIWYLNRSLIAYLRYRGLPKLTLSSRLLVTLLACVVASAGTHWLCDVARYAVLHGTVAGYGDAEQPVYLTIGSVSFRLAPIGTNLFHGVVNALFFLTIYELLFYRQDSVRYREQLAQSEWEREKLQMANLQSQLDVLKQQVNPHFLFNALNSLSSLISEDPRQAEVFVDKLSGVYRYVLQANSHDLTTLAAELTFIDAYYHLLQTRYGEGLTLSVAVAEEQRACQLPPLTLQLLVENAVKHNVVSPKRPLHIRIETDETGRLVVQNNRQQKAVRALSNGVGLSNIVAKYQMLNLPPPTVEESGERFVVRLPLRVQPDPQPSARLQSTPDFDQLDQPSAHFGQ